MKQCTKCLTVKSFDEFKKNPRSLDGYEWRCRPCIAVYRKEYYGKNFLKEKECNKKRDKKKKNLDEANYRNRNRSKVNARALLKYHVRVGNIQKLPCIKCGNEKSESHHDDYSKPLDVVWLCKKHHMEIHGKIYRGES